jgi:hypothetical protein
MSRCHGQLATAQPQLGKGFDNKGRCSSLPECPFSALPIIVANDDRDIAHG